MHLTRIRAGRTGVLFALMMALVMSSSAISQTPLLSPYEDGPPKMFSPEGVPKPAQKISFAFRASEFWLAGGYGV
jgi:hypothetical protein